MARMKIKKGGFRDGDDPVQEAAPEGKLEQTTLTSSAENVVEPSSIVSPDPTHASSYMSEDRLLRMSFDELAEWGAHLYRTKQYELAVSVYNIAIVRHALVPELYLSRALPRIVLKQFSSAFSDIIDALSLSHLPPIELLLLVGHRLHVAKRFDLSVKLFSQALDKYPPHADLWVARARSFMGIREFSKASSDFATAASLNPAQSGNALFLSARCHVLLGEPLHALQAVSAMAALGTLSDAANALAQKARDLIDILDKFHDSIRLGNWQGASTLLVKAQRLCEHGHGPNWLCWRARISLVSNRQQEWSHWSTVLGQEPSADAQYLCGLFHFIENNMSAAKDHLNRALRLDPNHKNAFNLLRRVEEVEVLNGQLNVAIQAYDWREALDFADRALLVIDERLDEAKGAVTRTAFLHGRARALYQLQRFSEALVAIESAIAMESAESPSYKHTWTRGLIYAGMGQYERALFDFEDARFDVEGTPDAEAIAEDERKARVAICHSWEFYNVLNLPILTTDARSITVAYRRAALIHHPDKRPDKDDTMMKAVARAYAVLHDPVLKARYDSGDRTLE